MGYIGPSMDLFRNKFNNTVMFLYVSDDKEWIKNKKSTANSAFGVDTNFSTLSRNRAQPTFTK